MNSRKGMLRYFPLLCLASVGASVAQAQLTAQARPNILLILVDNLGYGELGSYGGGVLRGAPTPRIDLLEGMVRAITDILWTGSRKVRAWRGGDVRAVYYSVLAAVVLWGIAALRLAQPIVLLKLGANVAGVVFIVASLHLLYVNTRLLPQHVRPPMWRRAALTGMALFYGFFVTLSLRSFGGS